METTVIPTLLVGLVIGVVGFLLARAIRGIDDKLDRLDGKVDILGKQDVEHSTALVELKVRVAQLERVVGQIESRHEEFGRFLQTQGFRRAGG
jgi:hypothetical protein